MGHCLPIHHSNWATACPVLLPFSCDSSFKRLLILLQETFNTVFLVLLLGHCWPSFTTVFLKCDAFRKDFHRGSNYISESESPSLYLHVSNAGYGCEFLPGRLFITFGQGDKKLEEGTV